MLTAEQIRKYVSRVNYKPEFEFEVLETEFESPRLFITAKLPNAYKPAEMVDLGIMSHIPPMRDYEQLRSWLMWRLERIESHEAREWFTVDGERPFDPHAEA